EKLAGIGAEGEGARGDIQAQDCEVQANQGNPANDGADVRPWVASFPPAASPREGPSQQGHTLPGGGLELPPLPVRVRAS
ncbi:MAG: hypothetical protein RMJ98_03030, partial [Myxococcales bacterium]|nr:hypothetical protein [Myxococcales bacterium]